MPKCILSIIFFILCILNVNFAHARPYHGDIFTFYQPDGQEFQARLFGDEYYVVIESLEGYTLTKEISSGFYCYAQSAPDNMSFISTGIKAGETLPADINLKKSIRLSHYIVKQIADAAREQFGVDSKGRLLPSLQLRLRPRDLGYERWSPALEQEATLKTSETSIQPGPPSETTDGTRVGLLLLAQFPDRPGDVSVSQSQVDAYANDPSYNEFSNATSVYGYFNIQSDGKLQYNCVVTSYFTAAQNRDYYTDNAMAFGTRAKELINEGLAVLKENDFDFTTVDADSDGILDGVNIFYAGDNVNNWSEGLWHHKWISSWAGLSGTGINTNFQYQIVNIGSELSLGTFCHENGHMICDFPDLYSFNANAAEINNYSLMANGGTKHPVSIDAYLKIHAGWATVVDVTSASHLRGAVEVDKNTFYRFRNPNESREYFLLSMRNNTGYEGVYGGSVSAVNPTNGLVIWHAREHGSNTYSSIFSADSPAADYSTPYELMVVEANPSSSTTPWYDDPYPGSNDGYHSGDVSEASDSTSPALQFWNTATGRTTTSNMHVHTVSAQSNTMTFTIGTGAITSSRTIGLTSASLAPDCDFATDAAAQTFAVFNSGTGTLNYAITDNVSWLSIDPTAGTAIAEADLITVSYDTDALASGTYNGTITITAGSATNSPQTLPVSLTVHSQAAIGLSTATVTKILATRAQGTDSLIISNSGGGTLFYTLSEPASWLQLSSTSGTIYSEEDEIELLFDASLLFDGVHTTAISISGNAVNSPRTIDVTLTVIGNIAVNTPDGGETLWQGNQFDIRWLTNGQIGENVQIDLYKGGALQSTVAATTDNDGFHSWDIPAGQTIGSDYKIRISDAAIPSLYAESSAEFSIAALPTLVSIPYSESFETNFGDWNQAADDHLDWTRDSGGTPSSGTGPSAAQDGSFYIYTESSSPNFPSKSAILETSFDLRTATAPIMHFSTHMYGATMGKLEILASSDQKIWTTLYSKSGDQGNSWTSVNADLSSLAGKAITVQIIGITGNSFTSDMALDALSITESTRVLSFSSHMFTESISDDGSIANSITITLSGDTFTAEVISGGHITAANVPDGLIPVFTHDSSTQISFSLSSNAYTHAREDSIQNLVVVLTDAAFTNGNATAVAGNTKSMYVNFIGTPKDLDLRVSNISVSDNLLTPNQSYTIFATVKNAGRLMTLPTTIRYYLSTDATITSSDTEITTDSVESLVAGASSTKSTEATAPGSAGTFWIGACVDAVDGESDTENQCSAGIQITISQPDLTVISPSVSASILIPNQTYILSATVENQGTRTAAATTMRYYLSTDATITSSDTEITTDSVESLVAGASSTKSTEATAHGSAGTFWVGACVDAVDREPDTENQCSAGVQITIIQPDLTVISPSVSASSLTPNQTYILSATVQNQGTRTAAATTLRYYLSIDATITSSDTEITTDSVESLAAGALSPERDVATAPANAGTFWVGACVDAVDGESDTENQCSAGVQIRTTQPDLIVVAPSVSASLLTPSQAYILSATVENQGTETASATTMRYYLSTDLTITNSDTEITTTSMESLAAGASSLENFQIAAPAAGVYWVGICVDAVANESDINNQCSTGVFIEVTAFPWELFLQAIIRKNLLELR